MKNTDDNLLRILIVEDDSFYTQFMKLVLETEFPGEVVVRSAACVSDAVGALIEEDFGLVLSDLGLPDSEGIATVRKLLELTSAPIVVLTGTDDDELATKVVKEGAQDCLLKQTNNGTSLIRAIRYALERKRLIDAKKRSIKELLQANVNHEKAARELERANRELAQEVEFRKAAEAGRALLATAIEQSVENVVITNTKGTIVYVNPAFEALTGYSLKEAVGANTRILNSGHQNREFYMNMWATILSGKVWKGRLKNKGKDGSLFEVESTISPVFSSDGEIANFVALFRDVTREADLEYRLMQAQKLEAIGQLAAGIAHEINTPAQYVGDNIRFMEEALNGLCRMVEFYDENSEPLQVGSAGDKFKEIIRGRKDELDIEFLIEEIPAAIKQSMDGVERISSIVQAMKNFSHPGSEEMSASDLAEAIRSTVTVARNEWKYVADMELDLDPNLPLVPCFLGELNQAVLNMIVNATHAIEARVGDTGEKGTIKISARVDGDDALIEIEDTGTGIPAEIRDRIFEPFFTTKEVGKGTGQGMSIAYSTIVDKHKGSIQLDSEVDVGTTVRIRIPLETVEERYSDFGEYKEG